MKKNVEIEIMSSMSRISNLRVRCQEVASKLRRLEEQLENLNTATQKEVDHIVQLGLSVEKENSGQPEWSPARREEAVQYNLKLQEQKIEKLSSLKGSSEESSSSIDKVLEKMYQNMESMKSIGNKN